MRCTYLFNIGSKNERILFTFRYLSPVRAKNVYTSKASIAAMSKEERTKWRKTEKAKAKEDVEDSITKM